MKGLKLKKKSRCYIKMNVFSVPGRAATINKLLSTIMLHKVINSEVLFWYFKEGP